MLVFVLAALWENILQSHEHENTDKILGAISDRYSRKILEMSNVPLTARQLSVQCGIPISTTYRRLHVLQSSKLIAVSCEISLEGKKMFFYKSNVKLAVSYSGGAVGVTITSNTFF